VKNILIGFLALLLSGGCHERPKTLEDWGTFPIRAELTAYNAKANTIELTVENISRWPILIRRVSLLQVGRVSTHMTTAYQEGRDAVGVWWLIWPGGRRQHVFDLARIRFRSVDSGQTGPALSFIGQIPETDRQFNVSVITGNLDMTASYRP
jgi:hypothetical protein